MKKAFYEKIKTRANPSSVFYHLHKDCPYSFWLDSNIIIQGMSRYSYMGGGNTNELALISYCVEKKTVAINQNGKQEKTQTPFFEFLDNYVKENTISDSGLPKEIVPGLFGYIGYELKNETGGNKAHKSPYPDACFVVPQSFMVFDHLLDEMYLVFYGNNPEKAKQHFDEVKNKLACIPHKLDMGLKQDAHFSAGNPQFSKNREEYTNSIKKCQEYIENGESYEICLTNSLSLKTDLDALGYYLKLRQTNPAPYSAYFSFGNFQIACSSPELFLRMEDRDVNSKPIKGTLKRSPDPHIDMENKAKLQNGAKFRSENLMITDLLRNDLGKVCEIGSVQVPKLMQVESYASVHQLVSTITGKLKPQTSHVDCIKNCFPGGSMTGAPKIRTMELIDKLEQQPRGIYSGTLGYISFTGKTELNIVIRTAVFCNNKVEIGSGGAIIALSKPKEEYKEMLLKMKNLLEILKVGGDLG